jgi:hypothetical protein
MELSIELRQSCRCPSFIEKVHSVTSLPATLKNRSSRGDHDSGMSDALSGCADVQLCRCCLRAPIDSQIFRLKQQILPSADQIGNRFVPRTSPDGAAFWAMS